MDGRWELDEESLRGYSILFFSPGSGLFKHGHIRVFCRLIIQDTTSFMKRIHGDWSGDWSLKKKKKSSFFFLMFIHVYEYLPLGYDSKRFFQESV